MSDSVSARSSFSGDARACSDALSRARELLQLDGSSALRLQAQQQAALELLQARKFGASDEDLEELLRGVIGVNLGLVLQDALEHTISEQVSIETGLSLADLNAWTMHRSLRRYQQLIINQAPFTLEIEGILYEFLLCRTTVNENILELRRRPDGAPYKLVSETCGSGFSLEGRKPEPNDARLAAAPPISGLPVLRAGDGNFAHFLWNELDPLLHLARQAFERGETLPIVQDTETVLDLGSLPGLERLSAEVLTTRPSVHVGAMWVSADARRSILASLGAPPAANPRAGSPPLVLLGVRGPGRRELIDEVELLIGLIDRLQRRWPGLRIVLDGFTVQHNFQHDADALRRAAAIGDRISRIQATFEEGLIESLHGLSFESYLSKIAEVAIYVTHEGTLQHKIGWLYPEIPGVCMVAGPHASAIAQWHLLQCEGASTMEVLPVGLLQHQNGEGLTTSDPELRNQPFYAQDPIAVQEAIENLLAPHLASWTEKHLANVDDLVSAIWGEADVLEALTAFENLNLATAGESRQALFNLCDAVSLTHHAAVLEAALEHISLLPKDDIWGRLYRLRLEMIRGKSLEQLQAIAKTLLPDAEQLGRDNRHLLANLLVPVIDLESLSQLLPELPSQGLDVLRNQHTNPADAAELAAQLLLQSGHGGKEECARAGRLYSELGASLRRPFQPWDSPDVADPARLDRLVEIIAAARQEGRGFGLIRLGDGEGWFLQGRSTDLEGATRNGDVVEPELEQRGGHLPSKALEELQERLREALRRADVVGIPDLWQCLVGPEHAVMVATNLENAGTAIWPGGWHLHLQLLRHGAFSRPPFDRIDAVIAAALPPSLQGRDATFVPLPGEDPYWKGTARPYAHYPVVYSQVLDWIDAHVGPGQLVLVGGGLLGKLYVDAIRSRGGIGIDIGSLIDLCCGHTGHRGEHRLNPYLAPLAAEAFQQQS